MGRTKHLKRAILFLLCVLLLSACLQASARETTLSCKYQKITENGFVADTFNGVEAHYNLYGPTIYCSELIPRYYKAVYGVEIAVSDSGPRVTDDSGYRFEEVEDAQPGDALFATATARGKGYNHWAICKTTDPEKDTMTLFEQNWRWNGYAGVNRVIPLHGSCYRIYRLVSDEGAVPTLAELEARAQEDASRQAVVQVRSDLRQQAILAAALVL